MTGIKVNVDHQPETTLTNIPEEGCDNMTATPIDLFKAWMEYVYSERIKNGLYGRLPQLRKGRCRCNKSGIGYPHWPPTSFDEAKVQFEYRLREKNSHRKYLTYCWWAFCNNMAARYPWNDQQIYRRQAEEIERRCPSLQKEPIQEEEHHGRPKGWRCFEYCEPTLRKGAHAFASVSTIWTDAQYIHEGSMHNRINLKS
jgi:hypothetical protein